MKNCEEINVNIENIEQKKKMEWTKLKTMEMVDMGDEAGGLSISMGSAPRLEKRIRLKTRLENCI